MLDKGLGDTVLGDTVLGGNLLGESVLRDTVFGGNLLGERVLGQRGRLLLPGPSRRYEQLFFDGLFLFMVPFAPDQEQATAHHQSEEHDLQRDTSRLLV